jgi:hypothetical protein
MASTLSGSALGLDARKSRLVDCRRDRRRCEGISLAGSERKKATTSWRSSFTLRPPGDRYAGRRPDAYARRRVRSEQRATRAASAGVKSSEEFIACVLFAEGALESPFLEVSRAGPIPGKRLSPGPVLLQPIGVLTQDHLKDPGEMCFSSECAHCSSERSGSFEPVGHLPN